LPLSRSVNFHVAPAFGDVKFSTGLSADIAGLDLPQGDWTMFYVPAFLPSSCISTRTSPGYRICEGGFNCSASKRKYLLGTRRFFLDENVITGHDDTLVE
jgi:hypothetical protein